MMLKGNFLYCTDSTHDGIQMLGEANIEQSRLVSGIALWAYGFELRVKAHLSKFVLKNLETRLLYCAQHRIV